MVCFKVDLFQGSEAVNEPKVINTNRWGDTLDQIAPILFCFQFVPLFGLYFMAVIFSVNTLTYLN